MQERVPDLLIFFAVSSCLILILGLCVINFLLIFKKRQLRNKQLLESLKMNFENDLLKTQLEIQEQTFQQISQEIHDNINLSLTLAKLKLNELGMKYNEELTQPIQIIGEAINDLTDLSRSINSDVIQECGLITAFTMELKRIQKLHQIKFDFCISGSPVFLDAKTELFIFRIMQEALNNILKHAKATLVYIEFLYKVQSLTINIKDNGRGFDPRHLEKSPLSFPSSGLRSMFKRMEYLKGKMEISSKPEKGTHLSFSLPIAM